MTIKTGSGIVNPPFTPATGGGRITLKSICLAILLCDLCFFIFSSWRRVYRSDIDSLAISIQDDSYYYLLPAFNLKTYGFFTFDGEHETYGFQPLYALLLSVQALFFGDRGSFLKSAIFGSSLLYALTALMIFMIVHRLLEAAGPKSRCLGALLGAHLFLLNMTVMYSFTTCKENTLYAFILSLAIFISIQPDRAGQPSSGTRLMGLAAGLLVSMLVLTRLTPASLLISGALAVAWIIRRRPAPFMFIAGCMVPLLAWGAYAQIEFGSLMPISGKIKTMGLSDAIVERQIWKEFSSIFQACLDYIRRISLYAVGRGEFILPQYLIEPRPHP